MVSVRSLSIVAGAVAVSAAASLAAPIAPPAWVQASATPAVTAAAEFRTYQQWDTFSNVNGPNAPLAGIPASSTFTFSSVVYNTSYNANGTANVYDSAAATSGGFVAGSGNIYSPGGNISPTAVVPLYPTDGFAEAVTVQLNVAGNPAGPIATAPVAPDFQALINGVFTPVSTLSGYAATITTAGAGMGGSFQYTISFLLPDTNSLTLNYTSANSSSSLDVLTIDTRSTVPEPASLALLSMGAVGLMARRRR